jgi:glycosyltransferase involved in cell wall biosynthesis
MTVTRVPELSVVMPVYNEADSVAAVVRSWVGTLDALQIEYEFLLYDDGSRDRTHAVLDALAADIPRLVVKRHANRGHGPTILRGYAEAEGAWIFQTDSDDEMPSDPFVELWTRRAEYDLLLGCRQNRRAPLGRRLITRGSRAIVRLLFGGRLWDVNTPYRLVRKSVVAGMLARIPDNTFAPNVLMSGLAVRDRLRIYQCRVPHHSRRTGTGSIAGLRQWKTALRCAAQTAGVALRARVPSTTAVAIGRGTD